jgi:uncharacterized glyoxalase superfamily protein PhnB
VPFEREHHESSNGPGHRRNARYEVPKGFSLSLHIKSTTEGERVFDELGKNGRVVVPLEKTFWAAQFGMVVDRFGIPGLINCEGSDPLPEGYGRYHYRTGIGGRSFGC